MTLLSQEIGRSQKVCAKEGITYVCSESVDESMLRARRLGRIRISDSLNFSHLCTHVKISVNSADAVRRDRRLITHNVAGHLTSFGLPHLNVLTTNTSFVFLGFPLHHF
jgi:hypothetical protein